MSGPVKAKAKRLTLAQFAELFERETGFDMMDRERRTVAGHIQHNIRWFRDWAEETAQRLEEEADRVQGAQS